MIRLFPTQLGREMGAAAESARDDVASASAAIRQTAQVATVAVVVVALAIVVALAVNAGRRP